MSYLYLSHNLVLSASVMSTAINEWGASARNASRTAFASSHKVQPSFVKSSIVGPSPSYIGPLTEKWRVRARVRGGCSARAASVVNARSWRRIGRRRRRRRPMFVAAHKAVLGWESAGALPGFLKP